MKNNDTCVVCDCGKTIGEYIRVGDRTWLLVGSLKVRSLSGICAECGRPYSWNETDKMIEALIARVRRRAAEQLSEIVKND